MGTSMQIRLKKIAIMGFFIGFLINSAAFCSDTPVWQDDNYLLCDAIFHQDVTKVQKLLDLGVNPLAQRSEQGRLYSAWQTCMNNPSDEIVMLLLQAGCDPHYADPYTGNTILHVAIDRLAVETLQALIDAGINVNHQNDKGETALHCLRNNYYLRNKLAKAQMLIDAGIDTGIKDKAGYTALEYAWGDTDLALLLITQGKGLNNQDKNGNTLLHSNLYDYEDCIKQHLPLMLAHGADLSIKNNAEQTVLDSIVSDIIQYQSSHAVKVLKCIVDTLQGLPKHCNVDKNALVGPSLRSLFDTVIDGKMGLTIAVQLDSYKKSVETIDLLLEHGIFEYGFFTIFQAKREMLATLEFGSQAAQDFCIYFGVPYNKVNFLVLKDKYRKCFEKYEYDLGEKVYALTKYKGSLNESVVKVASQVKEEVFSFFGDKQDLLKLGIFVATEVAVVTLVTMLTKHQINVSHGRQIYNLMSLKDIFAPVYKV